MICVKIRDVEEGDAGAIMSIYKESYEYILPSKSYEEIAEYDRKIYGDSYPFISEENLRKWIERRKPGQYMFVAEIDGDVVGFVKFSVITKGDIRFGYIEEIHVREALRNQGIGSQLLSYAENVLRGENIEVIYVEAHERVVGFFVKKGYVPLRNEPKRYMGIVRYIDLVKLVKHPYLLRSAMHYVELGNYRESSKLLEGVRNAVKALGLQSTEHLDFLYYYVYYMAEDLESQKYDPLVKELMETARNLLPPLSEALEGLALGIDANKEDFLCNYDAAYEKFTSAKEKLLRAADWLTRDGVFPHPPLSTFIRLLRCMATYYEAFALLSKALDAIASGGSIEDLRLGDALVSLKEREEECRGLTEVYSALSFTLLKLQSLMGARIEPRREVGLQGKIVITDFFYLGGDISPEEIGETILASVAEESSPLRIFGTVKITRNFEYISEDVLTEQMLRNIEENILVEFPAVTVRLKVCDENLLLRVVVQVIIFANGYGVIRCVVKFEDASPLALTVLSKLYDPSMPECNIEVGETSLEGVRFRDFIQEYVVNPLLEAAGSKNKVAPDNSTFHTIVLVTGVKPYGIGMEELLRASKELYMLVNPRTTLFLGADWVEAYQRGVNLEEDNIAQSVGLSEAFISVNERFSLFIVPYEDYWYVQELARLCELIFLVRFVLYAISARVDRMLGKFGEGEGEYSKIIDFLNRIKSEYTKDAWFYWSAFGSSYPEYEKFVDEVRKRGGVNRLAALLNGKMEILDKALDIQLNRLNLDLAKRSNWQQISINILTVMLSSFYLGEVMTKIWNIPLVISYAISLITMTIILGIIFYFRR